MRGQNHWKISKKVPGKFEITDCARVKNKNFQNSCISWLEAEVDQPTEIFRENFLVSWFHFSPRENHLQKALFFSSLLKRNQEKYVSKLWSSVKISLIWLLSSFFLGYLFLYIIMMVTSVIWYFSPLFVFLCSTLCVFLYIIFQKKIIFENIENRETRIGYHKFLIKPHKW